MRTAQLFEQMSIKGVTTLPPQLACHYRGKERHACKSHKIHVCHVGPLARACTHIDLRRLQGRDQHA